MQGAAQKMVECFQAVQSRQFMCMRCDNLCVESDVYIDKNVIKTAVYVHVNGDVQLLNTSKTAKND